MWAPGDYHVGMAHHTVSLAFLATTLLARGFAVSPVDCWGRINVNVADGEVGPSSVSTHGAVSVKVLGSTVDNRFAMTSARSHLGADDIPTAIAEIERMLA